MPLNLSVGSTPDRYLMHYVSFFFFPFLDFLVDKAQILIHYPSTIRLVVNSEFQASLSLLPYLLWMILELQYVRFMKRISKT